MCVSAFRHLLSIHSLALTSFPHFCTSLSLPPSNLAPEEKTCKSPPLEFRPNTLRDWRRKIETHKSRGMWVSPNKDRPTFPIYRVVALQTTIGDCNARPFSPASGSRCIGAAAASRLPSQLQSRTRLLKRTECYEIGERNTRWRGRIVFYWLTDILSTFIVATSNEISRRVPFLCHPTRLFLRFALATTFSTAAILHSSAGQCQRTGHGRTGANRPNCSSEENTCQVLVTC